MFNDMNFYFNELDIFESKSSENTKTILEPGYLKTTFISIVQILDTFPT